MVFGFDSHFNLLLLFKDWFGMEDSYCKAVVVKDRHGLGILK